jgi:3',5'-cyclic AMP phosphodiesterase CpdA
VKSTEQVNRKARTVSFALAHLSDVHLGPMPLAELFPHFRLKRLVGAASWHFRRKHLHSTAVSTAAMASIKSANPDHIACTGDLLNIAVWPDFPRARRWLEALGEPAELSFVPGNHDAYVPVPWEKGLGLLAPWMTGDVERPNAPAFPFLRLRRNIALIGLNTACPQKLHLAAGTLGGQQLMDLSHLLDTLRQQGFFRIVLIHHPPLPGLAKPRKALTDAAQLQEVLKNGGCELVLHGHNHKSMENWIETKSGPAPVIGVAAASGTGHNHHEPAGWNLFRIRRHQGRWQNELTRHGWDSAAAEFRAQEPALLLPP